jgi:hypothetical protein
LRGEALYSSLIAYVKHLSAVAKYVRVFCMYSCFTRHERGHEYMST